ncbi:uncharacterized protein MONBRDRAFT_5477, partial [Monosiga brevicollis MX1]
TNAVLAQELAAARATATDIEDIADEAAAKILGASCGKDYVFPQVPFWRCQPRLRDHEKDSCVDAQDCFLFALGLDRLSPVHTGRCRCDRETIAAEKKRRAEERAALEAEAEALEAAHADDKERPTKKRVKKDAKEKKAPPPPKYMMCHMCGQCPGSEACEHKACKNCCKAMCREQILDCEKHRNFHRSQPERYQPDGEKDKAGAAGQTPVAAT